MTENCRSCFYYRIPNKDKMGKLGWGNCTMEESWHYRSPLSPCSFEPSRWALKPTSTPPRQPEPPQD